MGNATQHKFRLRLLFQEIDLTPGKFVIGRAGSCNLTIEDPLASREHACIEIIDGRAEFRDLASRNGSTLNGNPVIEPLRLTHGDRIRIGSYEFAFIVELPGQSSLNTSTMSSYRCASCQTIYSDRNEECPSCGRTVNAKKPELSKTSDDTAPVDLEDSMIQRKAQMLDEVINMALTMGHYEKAAGFIDNSISAAEQKLERGTIGVEALAAISEASLTAARGLRDKQRMAWVLDTWTRLAFTMPTSFIELLDEAAYGWFDLEPGLTRYLSALEICEDNEKIRVALLARLHGYSRNVT